MSRVCTKWIDGRTIPSFRIGNRVFYVEATAKDGRPDTTASHVYSPIGVSGDNVFVRELNDTMKMAVLAEYFREACAAEKVDAWRKAR